MSKKIKIGDCFDALDHDRPLVCVGIVDGTNWPWVVAGGTKYRLNPDIYPLVPTLHLPIGNDPKKYGGAWFDRILSGEKREEYRENKPFNAVRLSRITWEDEASYQILEFQGWEVLHLTNGYGHSKPQLWAHIEEITIGRGNPEWGAPVDRDVFIIKLGDVFHTKNLKA